MSPRNRYAPQELIEDVRNNISRSYVLTVGVSEYDHLEYLSGPAQDLGLVQNIFVENPSVSIYSSRYVSLLNPTVDMFREALLNFSLARSARGDILILYFSGHGAVLGNNAFGFCLRDTACKPDGRGILPLSIISFADVVQTLSAVDVFPVFIIDACFSGTTAPQGTNTVTAVMQDSLQAHLAGAYAFLASSNADTPSLDSPFGGLFTRTLHSVVVNGLGDNAGRHLPFITLEDLENPLQERLVQDGHPLLRCHIGQGLPRVPIARNAQFHPDTERFVPYMKRIIEYIWDSGNPREIQIQELLDNVGPGAYGNHSKLSRTPWALLEDVSNNSTRKLSKKGIAFAKGELKIPQKIVRDAVTWDWVAAPETNWLLISEL